MMPTGGTSPTASYQSDADGRLIARPGQSLVWDHLDRLASVTTASGTTTYAYDPLDRLRTVTDPAGAVTRFRYTGLTTSAAQLLDGTGTVTRSIGNGWGGERLLDWVPGTPATDLRYHGTNAHHDTTWLADATGAVISSLRYDPWGVPRSPVPAGYTPFRFQGSWHDTSTDLAWVVTRWYAPSLGTFTSEDSLLGEPRDPDSRHLYAYGAGEPVGSWDPDGRWWVRSRAGVSIADLAEFWLDDRDYWGMILNANRGRDLSPGHCIWIPMEWRGMSISESHRLSAPDCAKAWRPRSAEKAEEALRFIKTQHGQSLKVAAGTLSIHGGWFNLRLGHLIDRTFSWTGRSTSGNRAEWNDNVAFFDDSARKVIARNGGSTEAWLDLTIVHQNTKWPASFDNADAWTYGRYIFVADRFALGSVPRWLKTHEYVHVLQYEGFGLTIASYAAWAALYKGSARNPYEAIAYLWEGWDFAYSAWDSTEVWQRWRRR